MFNFDKFTTEKKNKKNTHTLTHTHTHTHTQPLLHPIPSPHHSNIIREHTHFTSHISLSPAYEQILGIDLYPLVNRPITSNIDCDGAKNT